LGADLVLKWNFDDHVGGTIATDTSGDNLTGNLPTVLIADSSIYNNKGKAMQKISKIYA